MNIIIATMKAILDVVICVDSFKTIDLLLLQEGMYQLRFSMYLQSETGKIPLSPKETFLINDTVNPSRTSYHAKKVPSERGKKTQMQQFSNKDWVPQHILKEYNMYCT